MPSPAPNFTPKEVNIFLDKSICKWCLIFPAPPSESLFVCPSFFLPFTTSSLSWGSGSRWRAILFLQV